MRPAERIIWIAAVTALLAVVYADRVVQEAAPGAAAVRPRPEPGPRLSMAVLHAQGGVPLGWQPSLAPGDAAAGRRTFDELGCPACHRVAGERFGSEVPEPRGPELTGMGGHHPPAYFAEAILNPDAVRIDAPGYLDDGGRSTMPTYDAMTIGQLTDLVAYLASLRAGELPSCHAGTDAANAAVSMVPLATADRPAPPASAARAFFTQSYDVLPGRLPAFEHWFATRGRAQFLAADGLLSIETLVDAAKSSASLTTLFGFRDEAALRNFMGDPGTSDVWKEFDGFVGRHGHVATAHPVVYRAATLSAP
jgi:hypothetical protein